MSKEKSPIPTDQRSLYPEVQLASKKPEGISRLYVAGSMGVAGLIAGSMAFMGTTRYAAEIPNSLSEGQYRRAIIEGVVAVCSWVPALLASYWIRGGLVDLNLAQESRIHMRTSRKFEAPPAQIDSEFDENQI